MLEVRRNYIWKMKRWILFLLLGITNICAAAGFPLWGKLESGPHPVGFTARFEYDDSRTFRPKFDLDGKAVVGERARPIQIAIWYPAEPGKMPVMRYERYAYLVGQELEFGPLTDEIKKAGIEQFTSQRKIFSGAPDTAIAQLLNTTTAAHWNAPAAKGKFPLLVYAPGSSGTSVENPVLCEYLASHGYIVASLPSMGAYSRAASVDLTGFYAYMQDIEFVIGLMKKFPGVDSSRLGLIGFSMGGSANTLVQMRNFDVDAAVYLDTGIIYSIVGTWFRPSNYYNPADLRAPQLYFTRGDAQDLNFKFLDLLPYADAYSLVITNGYRHVDFISDGMYTGVIPGYLPDKVKNAESLNEFIDRYSLVFLNAYIKKDPAAQDELKKKPEEWNTTINLVRSQIRAAAKAPPREWEFVNLIHDGHFERARQIYDDFKSTNPAENFFREQTLNALGYEYVFRGNSDLAIKILAMNAEAFPSSPNAFDSLSEVYAAAGNTKMALETAQKGIDLLAQNTGLDAQRKALIQRSLEERIKKLQGM